MTNWTNRLKRWHSRHFADNGSALHLGPSTSPSELHGFKERTQFEWPAEFLELYTKHDGVGVKAPPDDEVTWSFVPTNEIAKFGDSIRDWFSATHPEIAKAFFPFLDWGSGDAVGYIRLEDVLKHPVKGIGPGTLFEFEHECYEFDSSQHWTDFLQPAYESIEHFLK